MSSALLQQAAEKTRFYVQQVPPATHVIEVPIPLSTLAADLFTLIPRSLESLNGGRRTQRDRGLARRHLIETYDAALNNIARLSMSAVLASPITK
jgi:hypothetical protein